LRALFFSAVDEFVRLSIRRPCWGWLLWALAAYVPLDLIAGLEVPAAVGVLDVVAVGLLELAVLLAGAGQILLPLLILAAAAVCGLNRWRRAELRQAVAQDTSGSILRGLSWADVRLLVGDVFERQGYEFLSAETASYPGHRQLGLTRGGRLFLVDCSDWRSSKVAGAPVRRLHERVKRTGAAKGFAVTSGHFTQEAQQVATAEEIELIDGRYFKALVRADLRPPAGSARFPDPQWLLAAWRDLVGQARRWSGSGPAPAQSGRAAHGARVADRDVPTATARRPGDTAVDSDLESAARRLTDLIRSQARGRRAPRVPWFLGTPRGWMPPEGVFPWLQWPEIKVRWPRVRVRRVADAVGILVSCGLIWAAVARFLALPEAPNATPWALLGTGSDSERLATYLEGVAGTHSAARILAAERPLGQFRFGPPPGFLAKTRPPEAEAAPAGAPPAEVVTYASLRELEAAFDVKYVPPPECYGGSDSLSLMVKCGNHRIRARSAFVASGGKVGGMMLGSWDEPVVPPAQVLSGGGLEREGAGAAGPGAGGRAGEVREETRTYADESARDWRQEWESSSADLDPQRAWIRSAPDPGQDWRQEWTPARQPAAVGTRDSARDWRQDWAPTPKPAQDPAEDWRQEWTRTDQPVQAPPEDWRQEWLRARQSAPEPTRDPAEDWRGEWTRGSGATQGPDDEPEPIPIERRHWVDDL